MGEYQKELTITVAELELIRMAEGKKLDEILDTLKADAGHQGWKNFETWHTNLCFMQDEFLYRSFLHRANHLLAGIGTNERNRNITLKDRALFAVSDGLRDYFKDIRESYSLDENSKGLLRNSYAMVCWDELAMKFMDSLTVDRRRLNGS